MSLWIRVLIKKDSHALYLLELHLLGQGVGILFVLYFSLIFSYTPVLVTVTQVCK